MNEWGAERERPSLGERLYDALALLLLMWPAAGGMWALGSTRTWGFAPGLVVSFCGSMLVLARPLVFRAMPRGWAPPGFVLLAVLTAYIVIRIPWAAVPYAARWEGLRWACLLAAAWSWTQVARRAHRWKWLLGVLLLAAALNSLYAVIQHVNGSSQVLWAPRPEQYLMRASGTYLCPNHFANMLAMLFPLALALMLLPAAGFPLRLMALYFFIVSLPVIYWTQSRSGWLGMVAGVCTTLTLLAWRRSRAGLLLALVALPLLAGAGGWAAWKTLPAVRTRVGAVLEDPEEAGGIRMQMWRDVPAMVRARPVLGFGGGAFVWIYPPYQTHVEDHLHWDFLHNEYLQLLVEYGTAGLVLGLAALAWCLTGLVRGVLRARSSESAFLLAGAGGSLTACLVHALFDFNFHIFPNPHALVWIGGVAWGGWFMQERGGESVQERHRKIRAVAAVLGALACAYGAWLAFAGGMSYAWNLKGDLARTRLDWEDVESDYRKAMAWDSWNWRPHLGMGDLKSIQALWHRDPDLEREQAGKQQLAAEAAESFRKARSRNACDMAVEFGLGRALNAMGDPDKALEHYRRAAAYQQRHIFYREQLGIQLRRMGRDREALEVFRRNVEDGVSSDVSRLNIRMLERKLAREEAGTGAEP